MQINVFGNSSYWHDKQGWNISRDLNGLIKASSYAKYWVCVVCVNRKKTTKAVFYNFGQSGH